MCRKGAWAELAAQVTFMVEIQSRTPGKNIFKNIPDFYPFFGKVRFFMLSLNQKSYIIIHRDETL